MELLKVSHYFAYWIICIYLLLGGSPSTSTAAQTTETPSTSLSATTTGTTMPISTSGTAVPTSDTAQTTTETTTPPPNDDCLPQNASESEILPYLETYYPGLFSYIGDRGFQAGCPHREVAFHIPQKDVINVAFHCPIAEHEAIECCGDAKDLRSELQKPGVSPPKRGKRQAGSKCCTSTRHWASVIQSGAGRHVVNIAEIGLYQFQDVSTCASTTEGCHLKAGSVAALVSSVSVSTLGEIYQAIVSHDIRFQAIEVPSYCQC